MKKKFLSLAIAILIAVSFPISAFAASDFDITVFDTENVNIVYDDMEDTYRATEKELMSLLDRTSGRLFPPQWATGFANMYPTVSVDDSVAAFFIYLDYYLNVSWGWDNLDTITIKIGDNRYIFTNIELDKKVGVGGKDLMVERMVIAIDENSMEFMEDLTNHKNDEIKMRLSGSGVAHDIILTDIVKESIVDLYDLYVKAGGTNTPNIRRITDAKMTNLSVKKPQQQN